MLGKENLKAVKQTACQLTEINGHLMKQAVAKSNRDSAASRDSWRRVELKKLPDAALCAIGDNVQ